MSSDAPGAVKHDFSAGGVVVRGDDVAVIVPVKRSQAGEQVLGLPKGHPDHGESPEEAAKREVREETGLDAELIDKLGEIDYCYRSRQRRVHKRVVFYLFGYVAGDLADHDAEIEYAMWMPLSQAAQKLTYAGEREMVSRALSRAGADR